MSRKPRKRQNLPVTSRPNANLGQKYRLKSLFRRIFLLLVITGGILLISQFKITEVRVEGYKNPERMKEVVQAEIDSNLLWGNLLFLPAEALASSIENSPHVKTEGVLIKKNWLGNRLDIIAKEREVQFLWKTGGDTYSIDSKGRVIASFKEIKSEFIVVEDTSNIPVTEDMQVVPASFVNFVTNVTREIADKTKLKPLKILVEESISEAVVTTENKVFLRFSTIEDVYNQVENIKLTLEHATKQNETINSYIDVRIPYKAYYR
ncbi:MAG: hypothetical protein WDZ81_00125 [Candidatus Saccharimonadales bacterium]